MSRVSKFSLGKLLPFAIALLLAKAVGVVLVWMLPMEGVSLQKHYTVTPPYIRVDLGKLFGVSRSSKSTVSTLQSSTQSATVTSISGLILKGLYGGEKKGFAIIAKKSSPNKTRIIALGESIEGYRLKAIRLHEAVFEKGGKEYVLKLQKSKSSRNVKLSYAHSNESRDDGGIYVVSKSDIKHFASNPREIWKNIAIHEIRSGREIRGFKVTWVKPGSKFAQIGIKKGDVIIKANNKRLKSYKDAIDIYANINKLREVSIVVLRNGEEKELIYEIH